MALAGHRIRGVGRLTALAAWHGLVGFYRSDNLTYAASIAYYALLSLFPFSMLGLAILANATSDEESRTEVLRFILRYFPQQFEFIANQFDALSASVVGLSVASALFLVWGSFGVFGAVTSAVNHAWGVEKARSFWQHKLVAFVMMLCAGLILLATLLVVTASHVVDATWFAQVLARFPALEVFRSLLIRYATTALFIGVVGLIYYFVPNADVRFRDVWVGAAVTGLLWSGVLDAFTWMFRDLGRLSAIHGSIAAVVVFLIWVYTQAVILLYGAELTAAYARLRRGRPDTMAAAPTPRIDAF
ncbi:MAG: YihY/virulence factor BrkB family protein [Vicinamibacterales bacterium]